MIRTTVVCVIILYGLVQSLRGPFYALLLYLWIAYFRPEAWLWADWVSQWNLSLLVGILVLLSTIFSGRGIKFGVGSVLMLLLLLHSLISTAASPAFTVAFPFWQEFAKTTVISILIVSLVDDERSLRLVIMVVAFSLGLESVKQGWAQMILNPGAVNTNDIPLLGDNNGVAVGMFMLAPLFIALARTAGTRMEKLICHFSLIGVLYRGISTFSRGGFLACGALGFHYFLRSNRKFVSVLAIAVICVLIVPVLSEDYWDRIGTITTATDKPEESGGGRLHFWRTALLMANDRPLTGVGTRAFSAMYDHYDTSAGEYGVQRAVHSSWFGVLAELGYPGLLLFILIVGYAFVVCRRARRAAHRCPELVNLAAYAIAIEGSLVAFIVGGTFVHFQYVEILWHTLALSAVIDRLVSERLKALATVPAPAVVPASAAPRIRPVIRPVRA